MVCPLLFIILLEALSRGIRSVWTVGLLYADYLILVSKSLEGLKRETRKLERSIGVEKVVSVKKNKKQLLVMKMLFFFFFFFLLFGEKVHVAIPFSSSFSRVGCIKDGVVSDINSIEKSNMC